MDIRKIKKLIELITESDIEEIEIKEGEESIRINRRKQVVTSNVIHSPLQAGTQKAPEMNTPIAIAPPPLKVNSINAPMVGTFYRAPSPESVPYAEVGQNVKAGEVICIIEAMKMMNQIEADRSGIIESIEASDGEPIEFDQVLFIIA